MKPKAPKKRDPKPSAKSGEVRQKSGVIISMIIKSNIGTWVYYSDGRREKLED